MAGGSGETFGDLGHGPYLDPPTLRVTHLLKYPTERSVTSQVVESWIDIEKRHRM